MRPFTSKSSSLQPSKLLCCSLPEHSTGCSSKSCHCCLAKKAFQQLLVFVTREKQALRECYKGFKLLGSYFSALNWLRPAEEGKGCLAATCLPSCPLPFLFKIRDHNLHSSGGQTPAQLCCWKCGLAATGMQTDKTREQRGNGQAK